MGETSMADVYVTVSYKLLDSLGDTVSVDDYILECPDGLTLAQLQTHIDIFTNAFDNVTDCSILAITAKVEINIVGAKADPVEGSEVQRNARISWGQATIAASYGYDIPGVKDELIVGGKLNTADALITAFNAALLDVSLADAAQVVTKQKYLLTSPRSALLSFRGDRGPQDRSTF